jgi:hypothetical protein
MPPETTVLPTQFLPHWKPDACLPERRLMVAVLALAFTEYQQYAAKGCRNHRGFTDVAAWFASADASWPFSFVALCEALGLNPRSIRAGLRSYHAQARPVVPSAIRGM